jgi:hypothetical protein
MPFYSSGRLQRIENLLREVLANQNRIFPTLEVFLSTTPITLAQLTADETTLATTLTTGLNDLTAEIAALKAANPGTDFSSLDSIVTGMTAQITAVDPGPQSTGTASVQSAVKKS